MEKKTYKDFVIGQEVICYSLDRVFDRVFGIPDKEFWEEKLTVGKTYKIEDVDWHFPDKIVVKCEYGGSMFVPIAFFVPEIAELRDKKINDILGDITEKLK